MLFRQVLNESVFLIVCHTLTVFYRSSKRKVSLLNYSLFCLIERYYKKPYSFYKKTEQTRLLAVTLFGTENKIALNPRCYTQIYKFLFATKVRILNLSPKLSAYRHDTLQFGITQKVCKLDKKNSLYIQSPSYIYELQRREYLFGRTV